MALVSKDSGAILDLSLYVKSSLSQRRGKLEDTQPNLVCQYSFGLWVKDTKA